MSDVVTATCSRCGGSASPGTCHGTDTCIAFLKSEVARLKAAPAEHAGSDPKAFWKACKPAHVLALVKTAPPVAEWAGERHWVMHLRSPSSLFGGDPSPNVIRVEPDDG